MTTMLGKLTPEQELAYLSRELDASELVWAAGFFDGEGCVYVHTRQRKGEMAALGISVGQSYVTEELERFRAATGFESARIQGPFTSHKSSAPRYRFVLVGKRAHLAMQRLLPHLCSRKREKYLYLIATKGV